MRFDKCVGLCFVGVLAACGGGSSSPTGATAPQSAEFRGNSVDLENGKLRRERLHGFEDASTGALTVDLTAVERLPATERVITVTDPDGLDATGAVSDGTVSLATFGAQAGITDVYMFTRAMDATGAPDWGMGVYGNRTPSSAIANTGTATYSGTGRIFEVDAIGPLDLVDATSSATADFGAATVDVSLSSTGGAIAGVDQVTFTGLAIKDSYFTGNGAQVLAGGSVVGALGKITRKNMRGRFFGPADGAGIPDEIGGVFYIQGDTATIAGAFTGD